MPTFQGALDLDLAGEPPPVRSLAASVSLVDGLPRLVPVKEPRGVVYTRPWVADLILDLTGYRVEEDLAARYAVEPAAGEGAFLVPMVRRMIASGGAPGRKLSDASESIRAYEPDGDAAASAVALFTR